MFNMVLQVTSGLTIRSAPRRTVVDAETYRTLSGMVIIPASSLKGALRHAACYAARSLGLTCCGRKSPQSMIQRHRLLASKGLGLCYHDESSGTDIPLCHVCGLFGSTYYRSPLIVEDAAPADEVVNTVLLPGLEIDDYSGTASRGKLYLREVIVPGTFFTTRISVDLGRLEALLRPGQAGCGSAKPMSREERCWWLRLMASAIGLLEAIGIGSGSVRAWITSMELDGERVAEPRRVVEHLGCDDEVVGMLREVWLSGGTIGLY